MFNTYLKLSFRTLWRKKSFSLLNILGLAVGIAASLLIFLVIRHEMSYDDFQSNRDRIYRVVTTSISRSNHEVVWMHSMAVRPLANGLRQDFPQLEKVAMVRSASGQVYIPGKDLASEKRFKEKEGVFFAEPSLFEIFDFTWLVGNATGLKDPNTVVLSQSVANTYFGDYRNAIGKTMQLWSYRLPLRVIGVFRDLPENTDVPVRIGASLITFINFNKDEGRRYREDWRSLSGGMSCFVLTSRGQDIRRLQAQLPAFVKKNYKEDEDQTTNISVLSFQPLKGMHLDKRFDIYTSGGLSPRELWALGLIGAFLMLVACINFINLATAQSVNRAKEIGVRKVLGSDRYQLLKQFLNETALITFLALILGCALAWMTVPYLNILMGKSLVLNMLRYPSILLFLLITGTVVTFLAGFYPAVVLSGFNPVAAIKSRISTRTVGGISLRRGLVVFQFVIAQLLVIGTLVIIKQMRYFHNQYLGFEKEAAVTLELPSDSTLKLKYPYLKQRLSQVPGVEAASLCFGAPGETIEFTDLYFHNDPNRQPFSVSRMYGDTGYLNTFRMSLAAGRFPYPSDTVRELLVNETLLRKLGLKSPQEILGKTLGFDGRARYPVVGVLRDFNNNSLKSAIAPTVMSTDAVRSELMALRLNPGKLKTTLDEVQKAFTQVYPTYLYELTFCDEAIGNFYKTEAMTAKLFQIAAMLAIFISCLGLYGLVSFMVVQKTKEVGIRKVLGASVQNILYLFSKEFTVLIGLAFLIAAPVGYYFMQKWLTGFHYHTQMGWGIFVLAIVLSVVIAWAAVGYKALRAALANPVKSLKAE